MWCSLLKKQLSNHVLAFIALFYDATLVLVTGRYWFSVPPRFLCLLFVVARRV